VPPISASEPEAKRCRWAFPETLALVRLLRLGIALNCGLTILKLNMAHG